jgi:hypothetical protein
MPQSTSIAATDQPDAIAADGAAVPVQQALSAMWRASPLRRRPVRTLACAAAIFAFSALFGVVAADWLWGAIAAVVLVLVTLDAFVATTYVADGAGLRMHGPLRSRHVRWQDVVRVAAESDGALLVMKNGRGVTVLLDSPQRGPWLAQRAAREVCA